VRGSARAGASRVAWRQRVNQTETLQRFIWGFMRSGEAAREAPASGGASPYRAGVNAGSGGELRPRPSGCTTTAKQRQTLGF
jgi:hypothetical protein